MGCRSRSLERWLSQNSCPGGICLRRRYSPDRSSAMFPFSVTSGIVLDKQQSLQAGNVPTFSRLKV